jgi:hypothetical protein
MSRRTAELVQALGVALITVGVAAIYWPVALIVCGLAIVILAQGVR